MTLTRCPQCGRFDVSEPSILCRATRWVSDRPFPGLVECALVDAEGESHVVVDKTAVFDAFDRLRSDAHYPIDVLLDCQVVRSTAESVEVRLSHGVADAAGRDTFVLSHEALIWCSACKRAAVPMVSR